MTRYALMAASLIMFFGGVLSLVIKDANGHPIGIPLSVIPWLGWVIIILGFLFFLLSLIRSDR